MCRFELRVACRAPALEVFKLLHDPSRFPDWWEGMERVEATAGSADEVRRFMSQWPEFAYPTRLSHTGADGGVRISCLLSDIVHDWRIEPDPDGCVVRVSVELPAAEAAREGSQRGEAAASLRNLVALAEAER